MTTYPVLHLHYFWRIPKAYNLASLLLSLCITDGQNKVQQHTVFITIIHFYWFVPPWYKLYYFTTDLLFVPMVKTICGWLQGLSRALNQWMCLLYHDLLYWVIFPSTGVDDRKLKFIITATDVANKSFSWKHKLSAFINKATELPTNVPCKTVTVNL